MPKKLKNKGLRKPLPATSLRPGDFPLGSTKSRAAARAVVERKGNSKTSGRAAITPAVEQLYMHSFNETLDHYRQRLRVQQEGRLQLPNDNFDTGEATEPGTYRLTYETYANLLDKTSGKSVSEALRKDILAYYANLDQAFATKKDPKAWQKVLNELDRLKAVAASGKR